MMGDDDDQQTCAMCPRVHPIEVMISTGDAWICPVCYAEFRAGFDACEHEWEPHTDAWGDDGRYCRKCSGFVADEDIAEAETMED